jgi:hypothetical protein
VDSKISETHINERTEKEDGGAVSRDREEI